MSEPNIVDLAEVREKLDAYRALDARIKVLTETKATLRSDIERALGDNEVGKLDGHTVVTWKHNAKTRYFNKSALAKDHPALVDEYTELRDGNRVFKVVD